MPEEKEVLGLVRFGRFDLSVETGELRKDGQRLKLSGQAIQVLTMLAGNPGKLVTREDLQQKLWPGASYGDPEHGLNAAVNKLRETLGDSATEPKYIETVPGRGYRFIAALDSPTHTAESQPEPPQPEPEPPKPARRNRRVVIEAAALVVVAAFLYFLLAPQIESFKRAYELQRLTAMPLTSLPGYVWSPTFSPDGSQLAFLWEGNKPNGNSDLYVKVIGNDTALRLTDGLSDVRAAAWSPDGKNIAICRWTSEGPAVFLVSPLGGPLRKISSEPCGYDGGSVSWSPDGKHLAFPYVPNKSSFSASHLFVLNTDNMEGAPVKTDCNVVTLAAYSPTGDYLAWICSENLENFSIYLQRLSDGSISQLLTSAGGPGLSLAWSSDGRRIIYTSTLNGSDLWEVALARPNIPEKLPFGHNVTFVAVSTAGKRLAFAETHTNVNIWRVDLLHPHAKAERAVASSREQTAPDSSPDGTQITFQSNRSGPTEIWVSGADGSNATKLSSFGILMTGTPTWSPDGKLVAFDSRAGGEANIYLVEPHGGIPRKLDIDVRGNSQPSWSHDGKWIYFVNGDDVHKRRVWKVPSQGGHAVQISQGDSITPRESPDGHYVYFGRSNRLWRVKTDGTEEQQVANMPILGVQGEAWFPFGSGIYFLSERQEIDFFDLNTKETHHVFTPEKPLNGNYMGGLPVSHDGRWLLYAQRDEQSSNLMLVENFH